MPYKNKEDYNRYKRNYWKREKKKLQDLKSELEYLRGFKAQIDEDMKRLGIKVTSA